MAIQVQPGASKTIIFSFSCYIKLCVSIETLVPFVDEKAGSERGKQSPSTQKWPNCEWKASLSHSNAFILSSSPSCLKGRHGSLVLLVGICEQEDPDPDLSSHLLPHSGLRQAALGSAATHPGSSHPSGVGGEAAAEFIKSKR